MSLPFCDWLHGAELGEQGSADVGVDSPRCRAARLIDLDGGLVSLPDDDLGSGGGSLDLRAQLARSTVDTPEDDGVGRKAPRLRHNQAWPAAVGRDLDAYILQELAHSEHRDRLEVAQQHNGSPGVGRHMVESPPFADAPPESDGQRLGQPKLPFRCPGLISSSSSSSAWRA